MPERRANPVSLKAFSAREVAGAEVPRAPARIMEATEEAEEGLLAMSRATPLGARGEAREARTAPPELQQRTPAEAAEEAATLHFTARA